MSLILLILALRFGVSPDAQIKNILSAPNDGCDFQSRRENFIDARAFYGGDMARSLGDISGQKYSRLLVVSYYGRLKGEKMWNCLCDCGNKAIAGQGKMRSGNTRSCGCLHREFMQRIPHFVKHGQTRGYKATPEYVCWKHMRQRCGLKNNPMYKNYGGRGIVVCKRWLNSFENFFADMGKKPSPELTLERRKNNKGYKPSNCYWGTAKQQAVNRRTNRLVTANGKTLCVSQWSEALGWPYHVIRNRLLLGWSELDAVNTPVRKQRPRK